MEKQYFSEYPYGQFPTNFTKKGQKRQFEELTSSVEDQPIRTMSTPQPIQQSQPQQNSFDIAKLLPLLKMMSDKKSISSTDMLQMFIPLLGGNSASVNDIISLMNSSKPTTFEPEEDITPSSAIKIDEYKRVE